jgi:hypothetical protein
MANDLHFAVCIGIDRYPGFPGRDLGSARRDAVAFRDWLIDPDGGDLPPENVKLVTIEPNDPMATVGDARPQQREINRALADFHQQLREHLAVSPEDWPKSRMYIYAAGHGIGPPMGEGAVLMADADEEMLGNSIELSLYANWYLHCGIVHEVVIFADCCREIIRGIPPVAAPPFNICQNPSFVGTVRFVGYASRLGEVAWEPADPTERDRARGYFTAALIDGLRGAAADRDTGEVTAASLAQYVQGAVEEATAGIGPYPQRGELRGDLATKLVFRTGGGVHAPERTVRITLPEGFPAGVSVRAGTRAEDVRARRAAGEGDGVWELRLPDGFYQVVADAPEAPALAGHGLFAVTGSDVDVQL